MSGGEGGQGVGSCGCGKAHGPETRAPLDGPEVGQSYLAVWGTGGSRADFGRNGRFRLRLNGNGGSWEEREDGMLLRPDAGGELLLPREDQGYGVAEFALVRTRAEFAGLWSDFDPRNPLYRPLTRYPWRITSPYGTMDSIPNGEAWDLVISGENAAVTVEGDWLRWEFGDRWGYARRYLGTPKVDSALALHVPHFYDYWGRLGDWRPERRKAESGISFLASNLGGPGSLAARRLEVARRLSRWFPVAIPSRLAELFPKDAKLIRAEVLRTPRAKYEFVSGFSFHLCYENSRADGYLTEKPFDALVCGAVPLYAGDPSVADWIDAAGMIDCHGLDAEEIADRIRTAERDGTVERVRAEREGLVRVSLEEMARRVEAFCAGSSAAAAKKGHPAW